ncbi:isoamyl alcohol oxidase [Phyllosticta citriasiana]|uniref:Isoamyl alcohol oxidase n=1 Tax=Phyllosticta citriasiana TaxID=595635 RepID=A0ABR1KWN5_9PEZI
MVSTLLLAQLLFAFVAAVAGAATQEDWDTLNKTVEGRLFRSYPLAKPCFSTYDGAASPPDRALCDLVIKGWKSDLALVTQYAGFMNKNASSCDLDFINPNDPANFAPPRDCHQGSVSPYYIDVRKVSDIQAAFSFSRNTKTILSLKNTCHDYKGRSSAPNSLALWLTNLKPPMKWNHHGRWAGHARPIQICRRQRGDGSGGHIATVGVAGGSISGGGHRFATNTLGLGVDNVLQIWAGLPDGRYVTANECQNQDIFFALRGGGGGTFGVNVESKYVVTTLTVDRSPTLLTPNRNKWADSGWGGYITPSIGGDSASALTLLTPKLDHTAAVQDIKPVIDFTATPGIKPVVMSNNTANTYWEAYSKYLGYGEGEKVGLPTAIGSRLIPRITFEDKSKKDALVDLLQDLLPGGRDSSSVTPAWCNATWEVFVNSVPNHANETTPLDTRQASADAHEAAERLAALTPGSGVYQNEADTFQTDSEEAFWGRENYEKLYQIKRRVDPDNVLTCHQCIGWQPDDERYSCYPDFS